MHPREKAGQTWQSWLWPNLTGVTVGAAVAVVAVVVDAAAGGAGLRARLDPAALAGDGGVAPAALTVTPVRFGHEYHVCPDSWALSL